MKRRITRLTVLQTGKLLALLYCFVSVIMLPFMLFAVVANPKGFRMLFMVFVYPIVGFVGGSLSLLFTISPPNGLEALRSK